MRRFIVIAILLVSVVLTLGASASVALAEAGPFSPGDLLFPVQHYVEQQAFFRPNTDQRAVWFLDLMERRQLDMESHAGTPEQAVSVQYFNDAVSQVARSMRRISPGGFQALQPRLLSLLEQSERVVANLTPTSTEEQTALFAAHAKVRTFQTLIADSTFSDQDFNQIISLNPAEPQNQSQTTPIPGTNDPALDPMAVPFPAGSPGDEHAFFPLEGAHATAECEACHTSGDYQGTATTCEACHADKIPTGHYAGDCAACHAPTNWQDAIFDHSAASATDCANCHNDDAPANHYPGQCSQCHTTDGGWGNAVFNHAGFTNCQTCHSAPTNHYPGQCSNCHNPDNQWSTATFNHAGFTDCQTCHSAPANHYGGQCSSCHNPDTAWSNATFNHAGFTDCQSCHSAPANHYGGACSSCHNPNTAWRNASFNHAGFTDCQSCHSAPGGHYGGQCSQCHNNNNWNFNHSGASDCRACHSAPGGDHPSTSAQCSQCHSSNSWGGAEGGDEGGNEGSGSEGGGSGGGEDDDD